MKKIGFLSFGHWSAAPGSQAQNASDVLLQSIDLAVAAEELGADGAYFRVHHFARQLGSPFPLLSAAAAKTSRIEIGTGVIDMRYENPLYMAEDAGAASNATAVWAAQLGMNLQSSTLKTDETGEPLHIQQAAQIRAYREAWKEAGHTRAPRVSVSRSIFAIVNDQDRMYFDGSGESQDHIGMLHGGIRAVFGRSYADEPDRLVKQLAQDDAIAEADTLLLTVPNQLGVEYNAHVLDAILKYVAPELGWR